MTNVRSTMDVELRIKIRFTGLSGTLPFGILHPLEQLFATAGPSPLKVNARAPFCNWLEFRGSHQHEASKLAAVAIAAAVGVMCR
jgi:hypothetical protein